MNKTVVRCAFCHGKGVDPFGIMSRSSSCYVCGGKAEVAVEEPHQTCPFCHGTGVHPNTRMNCLVCSGKGTIHMGKPVETCNHCGGGGIEPENYFPCTVCRGKGKVAARKQEALDRRYQ